MAMRRTTLIICGIDIVLLALCIFFYIGKDRTAPVISFPDEQIEYQEGMDTELLLQGVTAWDDQDGDVTGSLLIEKVSVTGKNDAVVIYVARDLSNNIARVSRKVGVGR